MEKNAGPIPSTGLSTGQNNPKWAINGGSNKITALSEGYRVRAFLGEQGQVRNKQS